MSIKPEDIMPDNVNSIEVNGVRVRKATVGAVLANAKILESVATSAAEKSNALASIKELAPSLVALEMHKHVTWNNPEIQRIVEEAAKRKQI